MQRPSFDHQLTNRRQPHPRFQLHEQIVNTPSTAIDLTIFHQFHSKHPTKNRHQPFQIQKSVRENLISSRTGIRILSLQEIKQEQKHNNKKYQQKQSEQKPKSNRKLFVSISKQKKYVNLDEKVCLSERIERTELHEKDHEGRKEGSSRREERKGMKLHLYSAVGRRKEEG